MRRLLETVLAGALATASVTAATMSDTLALAIEATPNATQRVLVVMKDAPGARMAIQARSGDRYAVAEALKQNAALAQAALLGELDTMGFAGDANVKSNWLANTIILDATPDQIAALSLRDDVKAVEHNGEVSIPDFQASEVTPGKLADGDDDVSTWGLKATNALEARNTYGVDGSGVLVGILDTGYDGNHPLLAGKVAAWKSFISDSQTDPMDDNGHGSHCAGTIGGSAGDGPEIGMAPGVQFVVGKILSGSGSGTWEGVISGMEWVVDPDGVPNSGDEPRLVSNSWGGSSGSEALHAATAAWLELGIAPIFAAGNSGPGSRTVGFPGGYLEAYAVGATTVNTTIANFSSRGPVVHDGTEHIKPEISAPGKDVTSVKSGGGYWTISGTSMATPHVAGLAALLFQANPDLSYTELFEVMNSTSIDEGAAGQDNDWGHGRIDAMAALAVAATGGKLVGAVVDAEGNGVSHAKVIVNETGVQVRLKDDGSFKMTLPEGDYSLSISAFGFVEAAVDGISVVADQETEVNVAIDRAASGTVAGTLSGNGTAVQGSLVVLDTPLGAFESDASGAFSITLPAGTYSMAASAYGFEAATSSEFTVVADETTTLDLDLAKLPPILVVDDDDGKAYEGFYTAALGDTPHKMLGYNELSGLLSGSFLSQYETVIWFTGADYSGSLTAGDQNALGEYLDNGGRLFLSGQDIGYELKAKAWYGERLGASFVKDTAGSKQVTIGELGFAIEGGDGANNQKYPDVISAAGGEVYATYGDDTVAGVKVENGSSKVVYLSFGFEGIDSADNRNAVMADVLGYLAPSAAEMAARIDAVAAKAPATEAEARDQMLLTEALSQMVSTEDISAYAGQARSLRRQANFQHLN